MKTLYTLIFLLVTGLSGQAQDFTFSLNPSKKEFYASNGDIICFSTFTNLSATDSVFTWERFDNTKPTDWESEVCDPTQCALVETNSMQFTVGPNKSGPFRVTFLNPNMTGGYAATGLKVYANNDPANADTVYFIAQGWGTSIVEIGKNSIGVYPSPVSSELNIAYVTDKPLKAEIYTLTGVKVDSFTFNNDTYRADKLNAGMYFIRLYDGEKVLSCKFAKAE